MSIFKFPKIESPFERKNNKNGEYVVYDKVNNKLSNFVNWKAVEKLDGTNSAVKLKDGEVHKVYTRHGDKSMNEVDEYGNKNHQRISRGVQECVNRGWIEGYEDGIYYGEVVGEKIQGNPYNLSGYLFVPFEWARENLQYKSWGKYPQDFDSISQWFKEDLFSLFYAKIHGTSLEKASVSNGTFCEGIMFVNPHVEAPYSKENPPNADNYAKLRRDMFEWYEGERH